MPVEGAEEDCSEDEGEYAGERFGPGVIWDVEGEGGDGEGDEDCVSCLLGYVSGRF